MLVIIGRNTRAARKTLIGFQSPFEKAAQEAAASTGTESRRLWACLIAPKIAVGDGAMGVLETRWTRAFPRHPKHQRCWRAQSEDVAETVFQRQMAPWREVDLKTPACRDGEQSAGKVR